LQDVATKAYVDLAALRGLYAKESVQVATTTHGNLSSSYNPGAVIDGYTLKEYDRILIKNQINAQENGLYIVYSSGAPQRSMDLINGDNAVGIFTFIQFGNLQASTGWICNSIENNDVVGTHDLSFVQFSGLGKVTAGAGLSKNFNEIFVNVDNSSIEIADDTLRVKSSIAGTGLTGGSGIALETLSDQSHVTKLGTIESGVWHGTTLDVEYGGTGTQYFSTGSVLYGNGTNGLKTSNGLTFDDVLKELHIRNQSGTASVYIEGDNGNSQLVFAESGVLGVTTTYGEYGNNTYPKSLVIKNQNNSTCSNVQIVTQNETRLTVLHNGKVGVNTSSPDNTLSVNGTFSTTDTVTFECTNNSTTVSNGSVVIQGGVGIQKGMHVGGTVVFENTSPSTTTNNGSVVLHGGLSIAGNQNAANVGNGGALTVGGGASIGGDLYIGGEINGSGSSASTFAYLTITATDEAINLTTGSIITFGGVTIQAESNASSLENGGALLVVGGASVGQDLYVGGDQYNYGNVKYFGDEARLTFANNDGNPRYTISKSSNSFTISRYDTSGTFIDHIFETDSSGQTTFFSTAVSTSKTSASLVIMGGISTNSLEDATSLTQGGGITNVGGQSIGKSLLVGGDAIIYSTKESQSTTSGALQVRGGAGIGGSLHITNSFTIKNGNVMIDYIDNNASSSACWYYMGDVTSSYVEIEFSNGVSSSTGNYSLKMIANLSTSANVSHNHTGNMDFSSMSKVNCYIYKNTDTNSYHLFVHVPAHSVTNVYVCGKTGTPLKLVSEGTSATPDGVSSGFAGSWVESYTTAKESNLDITVGSFISQGTSFKVADNIPIIGYNNSNTNKTRDTGLLYQRYQVSNNVGSGDVVSDQPAFMDILPSQSTASGTQIKFSDSASAVDNYYNGWWIKISNIIRQIVSYNGSQRVAEIDSAWYTQNPTSGDTVYFYNSAYVASYFDEQDKKFRLAYATVDPGDNSLVPIDLCDLEVKRVTIYDTSPSLNASSGSLHTIGGVSVGSTHDAASCTNGGSLTTLGGAAIGKRLFVGDNIVVGRGEIIPQSSVHIQQTSASLMLESDLGSYSYIDFVETGTSSRYGILSDMTSKTFSITYSNDGSAPNNASKMLTMQSSGNIGIGTSSNVNSLLVLSSSNYISSDADTGYIGLVGGNTSGSQIMVYGNDHATQGGDIVIQTGCSKSSLMIHTNTSGNAMLTLNNNGVLSVACTESSSSVSHGAVVVSGGVSIATTKNAVDISNGGGLTVAGGASIKKDTFIGGDLYLGGSLIATGEPVSPDVTFLNTSGCSITSHTNNKIVITATEALFSMCIEVTPTTASEICQFEFSLPGRTVPFASRGEMIGTCSGYNDDADLDIVFNTLCVGVTDTVNALVKFQSINTGIHYLTVLCRYTLV
jgi:hypothetical protein